MKLLCFLGFFEGGGGDSDRKVTLITVFITVECEVLQVTKGGKNKFIRLFFVVLTQKVAHSALNINCGR